MSTNIQIDVLLQRLKQVSDQTAQQNRNEKQDREDALLLQQKQQGDLSAVLQESQDLSSRKALSPLEQLRAQDALERSSVPDLYNKKRPGAQRSTNNIAFVASGFNSTITDNLVSYGPPSLYPLYPNEFTETAWRQVAAGELRFVVGSKNPKKFSEQIQSYSTGFAWRLASNQQIIFRAWNYTRDGSFPPVAEMLLRDSFGGRYLAPREPMVTSLGGVLWLTWQYRVDLATAYGLDQDQFNVSFTQGAYAYDNKILFVRYDTRTGALKKKVHVYSQFAASSTFASRYLANCFEDDPAKQLRALGYRREYHVKGSKAFFLRAIEKLEDEDLAFQFPYDALKDPVTGKISATSWRVDAFDIDPKATPAQLIEDLIIASDNTEGSSRKAKLIVSETAYTRIGSTLFAGPGISPVPDAAGGATNSQIPIYVLS